MLIVLVGSMALTSAADWDNTLSYEDNYMKAHIKNWLGLLDLGTIELKSHKSVDQVLGVNMGNSIVMYYELNFIDAYLGGIDNIEFIDMRTGREVTRDYKIMIGTEVSKDIYECSYKKAINGTDYCEKYKSGTYLDYEWAPYNSWDIPKGKVILGLQVDVQQRDWVDVIWTIAGKKIDEHVEYEEVLTFPGLVSSESTTQYRGYVVDPQDDLTEIVIETEASTTANHAELWFRTGAQTGVNLANATITSNNATITYDLNTSATYFITVSSSGASYTCYYVETGGLYPNANADLSATSAVRVDTAEFTDRYECISKIYTTSLNPNPTPYISLTAPENNTITYEDSIDLDCLVSDNSGLTNVSLVWNGTVDSTNSSGFNNTEYNFTKSGMAGTGFYNWTCQAYDDANAINNSIPVRYITFKNDLTVSLNAPVDQFNTSSTIVYLNGTASDDTAIINVSLYLDGALNQTNSSPYNNTLTPFTVNLADGSYNWSLKACDSLSCLFTAGRNITIDTDSPNITIYYPLTSMPFIEIGNNQTINWSVSEAGVGNISAHIRECTLDYNGVTLNITDVCTSTNVSSFEYVDGVNTIIMNATDIFGNTNSTSRSWSYDFVQTAESYNIKINETDNETFSINLTIPATIDKISSFLNYNGTTHAADSDCTGTACYINSSLDIPLVTTGAYQNKSFYWTITTLTGGATATLTTSLKEQNVSIINLSKCGDATYSVDFNISEEHSLLPLTANLDSTFKYWLGSGTVKKTEVSSQSAATNYSYCINPIATYNTDVTIFLNASGGFESRNFDFINQEYTGTLQTQQLHLVNLTYETPSNIIIEALDQGLVPQKDILVNISRYFPDTNTYIQVESQLTDEFGQITAKLIENDVRYLFQFYDEDSNLLKESDRVTIACRAAICVLPFVIEGELDNFDRFVTPDLYSSTLTFDNTTNTVTFFWDDQTGDSISTLLEVVRYTFNESAIVCSNTSSSSLGTLVCGVGSTTATYKAQAYRNDGTDNFRVGVLDFKVGTNYSTYGFEGLLWVFILLFTCIGIGAFNPSIAIGLYAIGFVMMGIIGVISMPLTVFFANTIICILFIWGLNK